MNIIAMIPARFEASRFPGKLMKDLAGKSVILRTYEATKQSNLFDEVYVVTDSDTIFNEITSNRGKAIKSKKEHESGSDRIAEAVENLEVDIVVNVQGDEPFTQTKPLKNLLEVFKKDIQNKVDIASLKIKMNNLEEVNNPNNVKVVCDEANFAMYFSRSPIPFARDASKAVYYKHIGIYAFRKEALLKFTKLPVNQLEAAEKLENLRFLANGMTVKMVETNQLAIGIDTPEDLEKANKIFKNS
ncbi:MULTISPECIES: 3-deoxy-manno-octulosonate cytidylyltransferase [Flavobacteriaceae]|uniref:3-deoxy-manno-octulosonate cytidylyltransferase n=2 Tax=Flavobacteriaceae TaxID=49546 RepID=A0A4Y8AYC2_9FLAO|nr:MULTISPECIES: 3-deoxy-manno-octulosonate cytidylyltransferase [Flavobacteriaceae]TEW76924.1 3-deoxy-manno-octulosonate cytidylyltransferase [Gramella jeungdoensis]GGK59277.1 3-deoxy-manno-octulosonate cytidylyltransferase [Lutibacter litoralis]